MALKWHSLRTELVTTLKRNATDLISEIVIEHEPALITHHGLPAAYRVDVESYEAMRTRIGLLEGSAKGEKAIQEERALTNAEAKKRMSRWLD